VRKLIETKKKGHGLLLATLMLWGLLGGMIFFVDPESVSDWPIKGGYFFPGIIFITSILFLLKLVLKKLWLAIWWAVGITFFVYLRIFHLGNIFNGLLLIGVLICGQIYSYIKEEDNLIKQTDANIDKKNEQDTGGTD
jgi:hypothetical protein